MGTEVKLWQIVEGKLQSVNTSLKKEGKTEPYDLEPWIASNPEIIGPNIVIIGKQVQTKSGALDLLGIDKSGNLIVIEIKRDKLPREVIAQAIDLRRISQRGQQINLVRYVLDIPVKI
jgi:RecB family endonuclease NucS